MIEHLESRQFLSASAPVVTTTTSTLVEPVGVITPDGYDVIAPTNGTLTTTDTKIVTTAAGGGETTTEIVLVKSVVNYTDASGNSFSDVAFKTTLTVTSSDSPASTTGTYIAGTFTENGKTYLTFTQRSASQVDAGGSTVYSSSTPVTFAGPDAAAALAHAGIVGAV